jgi:y4mF family transcriptional regulator
LSPSRSRTDDDPYLILGRALRELRGEAGLTQEQLAARVDVGATYVSQIENGHRGLRWDTLLRVLQALGADLHQLAAAIERQSGI